jgi:hypothetical protein
MSDIGDWAPGCEGDFYKTAKYRIDHFFRGRKSEETRKYAWEILDFLSDKAHSEFTLEEGMDKWRWHRLKDMIESLVPNKIPHEITIFRLLDAMANEKLIEKKIDTSYTGKGKKPVFYRLNLGILLPYWAMSRERLMEEIDVLQKQNVQLRSRYGLSKNFLKKHYNNPEALIEEKYEEHRNTLKENYRERLKIMGKEPVDDSEIENIIDRCLIP